MLALTAWGNFPHAAIVIVIKGRDIVIKGRDIVSTPAGWFPQPDGRQRYWDGEAWTDNFAPAVAAVMPA
jgi:hypothetical protein